MWVKNQLLALAGAGALFFSSCQKDVIKEESVNGETVSSEANAYDAMSETSPPVYTSVVTNVNSNVAGFWQAVPARYSQTTKKYPLLIFIHGIGELGTNLSRINCCGLPKHLYNKTFPPEFVVNNQRFSYIVIAPQFKVRPTAAQVQSVIDYAKARFRVDEARVYVGGLSMGGGSTWDWSAVYGQNAAAIVPICGGTAPTTSLASSVAKKNLPIWAIYSYKDAVVPASWGTNWINWIDQYNPAYASKTKLTIYSDVDHNGTWGRASDPNSKVDGMNIYQWLLQFTRGTSTQTPTPAPAPAPAPAPTGNKPPIAKAGADQSYPKSWNWFPNLNANWSTDPDGWITKFYWSQVSGPSTVSFSNRNTGNTKVYNWTAGTYYFRVAVTDNKGAVSYDDVIIKITNN
ncbi:MAG: dienelactone hydrolase family protein [Chitinophagaceae bacterium]|nr:dienelactone hydrolase family protein [Chitinophagaceae bacterium]